MGPAAGLACLLLGFVAECPPYFASWVHLLDRLLSAAQFLRAVRSKVFLQRVATLRFAQELLVDSIAQHRSWNGSESLHGADALQQAVGSWLVQCLLPVLVKDKP